MTNNKTFINQLARSVSCLREAEQGWKKSEKVSLFLWLQPLPITAGEEGNEEMKAEVQAEKISSRAKPGRSGG